MIGGWCCECDSPAHVEVEGRLYCWNHDPRKKAKTPDGKETP